MPKKTFDPASMDLEDLFKSAYTVPVYQRPYSWDKENIDQLLIDIKEVFDLTDIDERSEGYYTGNIIIYETPLPKINGNINIYDIIDGQQRITTFALIFLSVYTRALKNGEPESDLTIVKLKNCLWKVVGRKHIKDQRLISLNSIEKTCFAQLFDYAFDDPTNIDDFISSFVPANSFEKRVIDNFKFINQYLKKEFSDSNDLLAFAEYLLNFVRFIVIDSNCKQTKVFSIFESINSKGKQLEDIDLIKTYIFSKLDEASHHHYLSVWGNLIIKTNDQLYDYLTTYIKAFIKFYNNNIKISHFKKTIVDELVEYYGVSDETEALKKFLDDLNDKVEFYQMLTSEDKTYTLINRDKFKFFYKIFVNGSYKHPKPFIFRLLHDYKETFLTAKEVEDAVSKVILHSFLYLSVCNRDSKDSIPLYKDILGYMIDKTIPYNITNIISTIDSYINKLPDSSVLSEIINMNAYKNKLAMILLAFYMASVKGSGTIDYKEAYNLLDLDFDELILDYICPENPSSSDPSYQYYMDGLDDDNGITVYKSGCDFPKECKDKLYKNFKDSCLNKIGNTRIFYKDPITSKRNALIDSESYTTFTTWKDITERGEEIATELVNLIFKKI
ncbi:MAG: DUF262 domain-containing protein [Abditibacteriota bacterium]|nr:DUF262 domain-containing protein [Abditibacteriota bacterium]